MSNDNMGTRGKNNPSSDTQRFKYGAFVIIIVWVGSLVWIARSVHMIRADLGITPAEQRLRVLSERLDSLARYTLDAQVATDADGADGATDQSPSEEDATSPPAEEQSGSQDDASPPPGEQSGSQDDASPPPGEQSGEGDSTSAGWHPLSWPNWLWTVSWVVFMAIVAVGERTKQLRWWLVAGIMFVFVETLGVIAGDGTYSDFIWEFLFQQDELLLARLPLVVGVAAYLSLCLVAWLSSDHSRLRRWRIGSVGGGLGLWLLVHFMTHGDYGIN